MAKLTKPAQVGATIFRAGVDERLVIERAQREYSYRQNELDVPHWTPEALEKARKAFRSMEETLVA